MNSRRTHIFLILLALSWAVSACKQAPSTPALQVAAIQVTDFRNKVIALEKPATRIVCLIESALSGLYMLQAGQQVVGVPSSVYLESLAQQYAALDERIKNKTLPSPGNWDFVSMESLVALQPDLVIIWSSQQESIEAIEERGIPVYGVFIKSFQDVCKEMADLGQLTGRSQRADSLIQYTRNEIDKLRQSHKTQNPKSVYFIWPQGLLETSGTTSTVNELIEMAGGVNACSQPQEHLVVNLETLVSWNPDVMVMWNSETLNPEEIFSMAGLSQVNAIKNNQVYEFPSGFWCDLWTLKFLFAVKTMAAYCEPEKQDPSKLLETQRNLARVLYGPPGENLTR